MQHYVRADGRRGRSHRIGIRDRLHTDANGDGKEEPRSNESGKKRDTDSKKKKEGVREEIIIRERGRTTIW